MARKSNGFPGPHSDSGGQRARSAFGRLGHNRATAYGAW